MVHYTISFSGATCVLSNIKLAKDEAFVLPKLPHNDSITYLIIKNSTIPSLTEDIIGSFVNVERFEAVSVGVEEVSEDAFVECKRLKHIDLSNNCINELEMNTFNRNPCLAIVVLAGNQLESLPKELFLDLEDLYTLDLSSNNLTSLSVKLLKDLKSLKFVTVSHNQLIDLKAEALIEQLPKLKQFGLRDNDFSAAGLREILNVFKDAGVTCTPSAGKMRKRLYTPQMIDGFECIPDAEYDRLVAKKKIAKLEQKLGAMQKKMDLMQGSLAFLLKEHEIEMNKKENPKKNPVGTIRAEELEREFQLLFQKRSGTELSVEH